MGKTLTFLRLLMLGAILLYIRNFGLLYRDEHVPSLKAVLEEERAQLKEQHQSLLRQPRKPPAKHEEAVICSMVLGEEAYLDEWLDYHLGLGFTHVYIYDNSPYYDLKQWGSEQQQLGRPVTVKSWKGTAQQMHAYVDCVENLQANSSAKWVALWDVDEFLLLHKHQYVQDFLSETCEHGSVSINWSLIGSSGWMTYNPQQPVTMRFRHKWAHPHEYGKRYYHFKSITRVSDISIPANKYMHVHYPTLHPPHVRRDAAGNVLPEHTPYNLQPEASLEVATVFHYRTKSWGENMQKCLKGRSSQVGNSPDKVEKYKRNCLKGKHFLEGDEADSSVWKTLTSNVPKYSAFQHPLSSSSAPSGSLQVTICAFVDDDEAYLDEWVDFHRALGFGHFFLFHESKSDLEQWATQKGPFVELQKLEETDSGDDRDERDRAWSQCFRSVRKSKVDWWAFMDVSDFFVTKLSDSIYDFVDRFDHKDGVMLYRQLFGTSGRRIYEPRPVTQRFTHREELPSPDKPVTLWNRYRVNKNIKDVPLPENVTEEFLLSKSRVMNTNGRAITGANKKLPTDVGVIHSYWTRSKKEYLVRKFGVEALLKEDSGANETYIQEVMDGSILPEGDEEDTSAWDLMTRLNPRYALYDRLGRAEHSAQLKKTS